jgi:hypothetical protein
MLFAKHLFISAHEGPAVMLVMLACTGSRIPVLSASYILHRYFLFSDCDIAIWLCDWRTCPNSNSHELCLDALLF